MYTGVPPLQVLLVAVPEIPSTIGCVPLVSRLPAVLESLAHDEPCLVSWL